MACEATVSITARLARPCRFSLLALMGWIVCPLSFGQSTGLSVVHESWSFREGAPQDVECLAQTADGYLWLGGANGLDRFDGIRFEHYRPRSGGELLSSSISALLASKSGALWIGHRYGGVSLLKDGKVIGYGDDFAASTGSISDLAEDRDGVIWAAASTGMWRFKSEHWEHLGAEWNAPSERIERMAFDAAGVLWVVGGDNHLFHLRPNHRVFQTENEDLQVHALTVDADGVVITRPRGDPSRMGSTSDADGDSNYPLTMEASSAMVDRRHGVWITGHEQIRYLPPTENLDQQLSGPLSAHAEAFPVNPHFRARMVDLENRSPVLLQSPKQAEAG
jgi:hypothetical protein